MEKVTEKIEPAPFWALLKLIWDHRKFLLVVNTVTAVLAVLVLLLLPQEYKSAVLFTVDGQEQFGQLSALLSDLPITFAGQTASNVDRFLALATSRHVLDKINDEFKLDNYYGYEYREKTREAIKDNLILRDNQNGTVTIAFTSRDPELAAAIANRFFELIKELEIELSIERAGRFRQFIEESYVEATVKLTLYEDSLRQYSEETGLVSLEDQVALSISMLGSVEAQKLKLELERDLMSGFSTQENPAFRKLSLEIAVLDQKISQMKTSNSYSNIPMRELPGKTLDFLRLFRQVTIQEKILEFLIPQVENARVEEKKKYTNITLIDKGIVPELKVWPRRLPLLIITMFLSAVLSIAFIKMKTVFDANRHILTGE